MKILLITLCMASSVLVAQPHHFGPGHEKARMMKKWKLIEYLDLNEEQSEKFFLRVTTLEKELKAFHKKERAIREDLHDLLDAEEVDGEKARKLIGEYFDLKLEISELLKHHHQGINDILSDEQQIKYALFEHQFKKKMKDEWFDKKGKWGKGKP
ncbi:MAG: periplasmic heavy metal sensor [Candidatus Marinimicrobia bacterium]|nr:periplasmic heavy metal sensor [Candidatus Neomarinimicrobiota bacterium]